MEKFSLGHTFYWQLLSLKLLLWLLFIKLSYSIEIILARDNSSKNALKEEIMIEIYQSFKSIEWHECNISSLRTCILEYASSSLVLDLSEEIGVQISISEICKEHSMLHLVYQDKLFYQAKWTYSIIPSESELLNAFLAILKHFNWSQGIFLSNILKSNWKETILQYYENIEFMIIESETNIEEFVNKVIFPSGSTFYFLFTESFQSAEIQNSLKNKKLLGSGNGILLDQESGYNCSYNGSLIITEIGKEYTLSAEDSFKHSIIQIIELLARNESGDLKKLLDSIIENRCHFSLVNIQNGKRVIVGEIMNDSVTVFRDLEFPGLQSLIPIPTKKVLHLSINAGTTNPGSLPYQNAVIAARGAFAIQDKINEGNDILQHFQIKFFNFDCGVTVFNRTFAKDCFNKDIDQIGLSHISGFTSEVAIGSLQIFKELNISIPNVGATNTDDLLSSTSNFPMYSRVQMSNSYICSKYPILIAGMGWKSAGVLYQNDAWGNAALSSIMQYSEYKGLKLVNPDNSSFIPPNLDRAGLRNYTHLLQKIIDSQARLLILIVQTPLGNYVLELLYDLGVRKGDLVICAGYSDLLSQISTNDTYLYKRLEVGIPMFSIISNAWAGKFGQDMFNRMISIYHSEPSPIPCYYVDAAYLISNALDYMINRGDDYTDPSKLMKAIRSTRFDGCSGKVSIEKDSNDRIVDWLIIQGAKTSEDGNAQVYTIGNFRPFSSQVISIINPIIYGNGSTKKPTDFRNEDSGCPFPAKEIRTFEKGRVLLFGICFFVALVMILITLYIWKKWWNTSVSPLITREEISIEDAIVGCSIAIEFFQYASMGPDFKVISPFLSKLSDVFSMKLEDALKLKNGVFWLVVDGVYSGIGLWVLLCLIVLLQLDEKFPSIWLLNFLRWLSDYTMPILGNLCFIPFISICLDIFQCDQSIGDNFTDSFLAKDCFYFCWKEEHLIYSALSVLALLLYEPLAIYCRPLWQELQLNLHVKTVPLFFMAKTVIQTFVIVLDQSVKRSSKIVHGIIFIIVMSAYAVFIFKFKPYNYPRFSWWQGLSIIGVIWLALLSLTGLIANIKNREIILLMTLIFGWGVIIAIGLLVQKKKYPSMLFRLKGTDTGNLFKFAFSFGKASQISLSKISPTHKRLEAIRFP
ncbi:unnamed protein product [Blepharisma stoltei]|uniref:Receptor ligand binding region domain-containing protein n=1 Tax=Blepharisma stoltei TaxID=1481888 RepID=A0AAU9KJY8_9CILI|nr:unnamed protein product [Blepharisma stoltei]